MGMSYMAFRVGPCPKVGLWVGPWVGPWGGTMTFCFTSSEDCRFCSFYWGDGGTMGGTMTFSATVSHFSKNRVAESAKYPFSGGF